MALTEEHKETLTLLRSQWSGDTNQHDIDEIEKQLQELLRNKEFLELPVFKRFTETATDKVVGLNALLLNDQTLFNEKGLAVFQERELWGAVLSAFGLQENNQALTSLEEYISSKITPEENA